MRGMDKQYIFLKTIDEISKGRESGGARYSEVRERWKDCPSVGMIHYFGEEIYFEKSQDLNDPIYIINGDGKDYIAKCKRDKRNSIINILTFIVALLTLGVGIVQLFG